MKKIRRIKKTLIPALVLALVLNTGLTAFAEDPGLSENIISEELQEEDGLSPEKVGEAYQESDEKDPEEEKEIADKDPAEEGDGYTGEYTEDEGEDLKVNTESVTDIDAGEFKKTVKNAKAVKSVNTVTDTEIAEPVVNAENTAVDNDPATQDGSVAAVIKLISVEYDKDNEKIVVQTEFTDPEGNIPEDIAYNYSVWIYSSGNPNRNTIITQNNTFTKSIPLGNKEYDIYAELRDKDGEMISVTDHVQIRGIKPSLKKSEFAVTASADDSDTGVIEYTGDLARIAYRAEGSSEEHYFENGRATGLAPGKYFVFSPAYDDENTYYIKTSAITFTVPGGGVPAVKEYRIAVSGDENVSVSKKEIYVKEGQDGTVFIKPVDKDTHFIDGKDIRVEPEENYESYSYYPSTGELTVKNIKGNISVSAVSTEKAVISSIYVKKVSFDGNGNYSEDNPYISTSFDVEVLDQFGVAIPQAKIYFRDDINGKSYTNARLTDEKGVAHFTHSYGIAAGDQAADYTPVFGTDINFSGINATADIHLILQKKKDLILYEDQIIGTKPGQNDGRVINVPDGYEIWTGEFHQGAITIGTGHWERAVNGEFAGLSSGQHAIRAGEKADDSNNTFYLASDYDYFVVPRGVWDIRIDTEGSENVIFPDGKTLTSEPGGTVYVRVKADDGYTIKGFSIDRSSNVSGRSYYSSENGYIIIEGVTGSITLNVKAVRISSDPIKDPLAPAQKAEVNNDDPVTGDTATDQESVIVQDAVIFDAVYNDGQNGTSDDSGSVYSSATVSEAGNTSNPQTTLSLPEGEVLSARIVKPSAGRNITGKKKNDPVTDVSEDNHDTGEKTENKISVNRSTVKAPVETKEIKASEVPLAASIDAETDAKGTEWAWIWIALGIVIVVSLTVYGSVKYVKAHPSEK